MSLLRKLYYTLSPAMRLEVRKVVYFPLDTWDSFRGKRSKYEPPRGQVYIGSGDFIKQGEAQLIHLKEYIDLKSEDKVLDIGSGIGRTAVALTKHLNSKGSYDGFDVVEKGVKWCKDKIEKDYPNFNVRYVPLNNDLYNKSKGQAKEFIFPYEDNSFNKVFLFSVFTHMSVVEIEHYLSEIARVLKPGGLCLATFFTYDKESNIENQTDFNFPVKKENYRLMSDKVKSANIALKKELLEDLIKKANLEKVELIPGYWKKEIAKKENSCFQDIVILKAK